MQERFIANPIAFGQVLLLGGLRWIFWRAAIYVFFVLIITFLAYNAMRREVTPQEFADDAWNFMLFVQGLVLMMGGLHAINNAVRRDFTTEMIHSHRQSPIAGASAALGYLFGATSQILVLGLINLVYCLLLASIAGLPIRDSLAVNGLIFVNCLFYWILSLLYALNRQKKTLSLFMILLLIFGAGIGFTLMASLVMIAPGLVVLTHAHLIFAGPAIPSVAAALGPTVAVGALSQLLFATVLFFAAGRKFHRDDRAAFSLPLALLLLLLATLLGVLSLRFLEDLMPALMQEMNGSMSEAYGALSVGTLAVMALAALLPPAVAARDASQWLKRRSIDEEVPARPRPRFPLEAAFWATLVVMALFLFILRKLHAEYYLDETSEQADWRRVLAVPLPLLFSLTAYGAFLRLVYSRGWKALWLGFSFLLLFWAAGPLMELVVQFQTYEYPTSVTYREGYDMQAYNQYQPAITPLLTLSPIGCWIVVFSSLDGWLGLGLIFQALVAAGFVLLELLTRPLPARTPPDSASPVESRNR